MAYGNKGFYRAPLITLPSEERGFAGKLYDATCTNCSNPFRVPFQPIEGSTLLCPSCLKKSHEEMDRLSRLFSNYTWKLAVSSRQRLAKPGAGIDRDIIYNLQNGQREMRRFQRDLLGGFFAHSAIQKLLAQGRSPEVAYLQPYVAIFEELLQDITPLMKALITGLKQLQRGVDAIRESQVQDALNKISAVCSAHHNSLLGLIKKEYPGLLEIDGVGGQEGGFFTICRIFAAIAAYDTAVERIATTKSS